jgi:hypothetical protein
MQNQVKRSPEMNALIGFITYTVAAIMFFSFWYYLMFPAIEGWMK